MQGDNNYRENSDDEADLSDDLGSLGSDENEIDNRVKHIVTVPEMLQDGLDLFYTRERTNRVKSQQPNRDRFKKKYGVEPVTACMLYEDMQKTDIEVSRIIGSKNTLQYFLVALNYLRKYPKLDDMESLFDTSKKWISLKVWDMIYKIKNLKAETIIFPEDDNFRDEIWIMSVDGTHVWMREPPHQEFSRNKAAYSHKYNKAAYAYELGISLTGGLIWMNGPFLGGTNDISMFRKPNGLRNKLREIGKKAIGDRGYRGEPDYVSYPNSMDRKAVDRFKSRALMRHETFNGMTKVFEILQGRFRHTEDQFSAAFEAVCVVCQYKLDNELPLFDILIEAVMSADDSDNEE